MFTALLRTCQVHIACDRHRHLDSLPSQYITHCIPSFRSVSSRNSPVQIEVQLYAIQMCHYNEKYCNVILCLSHCKVMVSSILCNCISCIVYLLENMIALLIWEVYGNG